MTVFVTVFLFCWIGVCGRDASLRKLTRSMHGSETLGTIGRGALKNMERIGKDDGEEEGGEGGEGEGGEGDGGGGEGGEGEGGEGEGGGEGGGGEAAGGTESAAEKAKDAANEPSVVENLEETAKNPVEGAASMTTEYGLGLNNKEDCEKSFLGGIGLLFWQSVEEPDKKFKETCSVDPSMGVGIALLYSCISLSAWLVCCKGRERFIGDPGEIKKGEAFEQIGLFSSFLRMKFCIPCICVNEGVNVGLKALANSFETDWCCLCLWAETVGYTGYLPTSATQCAAILQCWFLPIIDLCAPLRGHARQKIKETAKETNKGSLAMDVAIHCCFMQCATYQEALVAEATFNETSDQGDGMLSCMCLSKEYRVIAEVGLTDRIEVKHCKILRMVPVGSIVVQMLPPKADPTTGMLRAFVKDTTGQGWITIVNNRQKRFLKPEGRNPFSRGTPAGPEAATPAAAP